MHVKGSTFVEGNASPKDMEGNDTLCKFTVDTEVIRGKVHGDESVLHWKFEYCTY